jgi:hypothetical protein
LKEKLNLFKPSKYLTFSVHLDGQREEHDLAVCREGGYDIAVDAIKEALSRGFRVTTNTTLFDGADPKSVRAFFDDMMELGLEGMMLSPGYSYDKAPDQKHFLGRAPHPPHVPRDSFKSQEELEIQSLAPLSGIPDGQAHLSLHPMGHAHLQRVRMAETLLPASGWLRGNVSRASLDHELSNYGTESGNPACANCMVHSGYEASAVNATFSSLGGFLATVKATLFSSYRDKEALRLLEEHQAPVHPLVQISATNDSLQQTRA